MAANVKKGDKVRFLNMQGGGIVARVEGRTVYVEDEDGFEMPCQENEVVLIEAGAQQKKEAEERRIEEKRGEVPEIIVDSSDEYKFSESASDEHSPRFFLAFIKSDKGNSGYLDLYAVNDSNSYAFFTLTEQVGETNDVRMLHYGTIEPNTKLMLDKYNPQRIDNQTWQCQLVLFKKSRTFAAYPPVSTSVKVKATKFFRDNTFVPTDFFDERAVLYPIIEDELQSKIEQLTLSDLHKIVKQKERQYQKQQSKPNSKPGDIIEVDLHIEAILDSTANISNGELLQIQIARFKHVMEENINKKGQRIVFIHGVGNGVLKTEVRKTLERQYRKCNYQDASFKEYGYGATMVVIG
ncbi:MAG: DUF2027 domain-containing protein [Bacteroidales bacterium]|nr:DUF2027 domain-containing protein [Bacteroidales bacterium]